MRARGLKLTLDDVDRCLRHEVEQVNAEKLVVDVGMIFVGNERGASVAWIAQKVVHPRVAASHGLIAVAVWIVEHHVSGPDVTLTVELPEDGVTAAGMAYEVGVEHTSDALALGAVPRQ